MGRAEELPDRVRLARLHGVATSYEPSPGRTVHVGDETVVAVLAALGVDASTPRAVRAALEAYTREASRSLLPPTVVWRPGRPPGRSRPPDLARPPDPARVTPFSPASDLSGLPEGTELRVETGEGRTYELPPGSWDGPPSSTPHGPPRKPPSSAASYGTSASAPYASGAKAGTGRAPEGDEEDEAPGDRYRPPLGVHALHARAPDGRTARAHLVVAPDRMPAPPERTHGFMVQLYSLLSARSWGMGDLGDLADLAAWSGRTLGSGFLQINPLHAAVPGAPTDPSPYRPSSRRFPDPVHLRIEDIPEFTRLAGPARARAQELLARGGRLREAALRPDGRIDRDAVWALKKEALELLYEVPLSPGRRAAYEDFLAEEGRSLEDHATWCALAEVYGPDWRAWPAGLRDPRSAHTARERGALHRRVDFHRRLAWLTDQQLAAAQRAARDAGMGIGLVHDLAVGVHPTGSDTWARQDAYAAGMSVGAPPDAFNSRGQDWGLPPWRPDALADAGYAPYRDLLRGLLRHTGALRIDHVMGLFRLWWVPEGRPPTEGTYVRYDAEAMLSVLALEAHRTGTTVIGEDLGTVEPGVRDALAARGVLGTSVLWFERDYDRPEHPPLPPETWRRDCLATLTTHDLPTTAARLTGDHTALRHRLGLLDGPLQEERAAERAEVGGWLVWLRALGLLPGRTAGIEDLPGASWGRPVTPSGETDVFPEDVDTFGRDPEGPEEEAADPDALREPPDELRGPGSGPGPRGEPDGLTEAFGNLPRVPDDGFEDMPLTEGPWSEEEKRLTEGPGPEEKSRLVEGPGSAPGEADAGPRATPEEVDALFGRYGGSDAFRAALGEEADAFLGGPDEEAAVAALHRYLLRTPARMIGIWLPDAVGDRRPQNLPGTSDEYPNWRLPISDPDGRPLTLEDIAASPRLRRLMRALTEE
ncbi:4-alpha-glucanotransferase [Streptomyces sp. NPDC003077]|uniref:4-alpha-glucanotransferase n=1 Tax=Streptomyces sp. NPDC003077 TaxID=3154443 RepID=UPI0033BCD6F4